MTAQAQIASVAEAQSLWADTSQRVIAAHVDAKAFFRNDEISSPLMKGYTLPGFRLRPTLSYRHGANASLEAGAYLLHYWGEPFYPRTHYASLPDYDPANSSKGLHALPFMQARLATNFGLTIVLGNLYGASAHSLAEPLFSHELDLTADPEAGMQLLLANRWVDADVWADWRTFIFNDSPHCENFIFGISAAIKPTKPESRLKLEVPVQLVAEHIGGEIDTLRRVSTLLNFAAGARLSRTWSSSTVRQAGVEALWVLSRQVAGSLWTRDNGGGLWAKAWVDIAGVDLEAAYFANRNFCTLMGFPLFGRGATKGSMWMAKAAYAYTFAKGFELSADAQAYFADGKASFCIGATANINLDFTLIRFKR